MTQRIPRPLLAKRRRLGLSSVYAHVNQHRGRSHGAAPILKDRLRLPVIAAPLFIISHPALTIAQCKAGVIGAFPALNARPDSALDDWLAEITETLAAHDRANPDRPSAPFAVNQIVHKTNRRLEHDLALCVKYRVPIVISSLGAVPEVNAAIHAYGGLVLHDVINDRHARSAINKGADGLIAVAAGAGGHAGTLSPFALVQEIRAWFEGPLLLSGAIATAAPSSPPRPWAPTWPISARPSLPPTRRVPAPTTSR